MTGPRLKTKSPTNSTLILGWSQQTASKLNEQIEGCYVEDGGLPPPPPPPPPPTKGARQRKKKHIPHELVDISRRWKTFRQNNRRKLALAIEEEKNRRQEITKLHEAAIFDCVADDDGTPTDCEILLPQVLYREQQQPNKKKKGKKGKTKKDPKPSLFTFKNKHGAQRIVSPIRDNGDDPATAELALDVMKKTVINDDDTEATSTCSSLIGDGIEDWSVSSTSEHSAITQPFNNTCRYKMEVEMGKGEVYVDPWTAAKRGNMDILEKFVTCFPNYDWSRLDKCGYTPLHYACQYGANHDLMVVAFLLLEWIKNEGQMPPKFVLKRCKRNAANEFVIRLLDEPHNTRQILAQWEKVKPWQRYIFEGLGIIEEEPEPLHDSDWENDADDEREKGEVETEIFKRIVPIEKRPIGRRQIRAQ